MVFARHGDGVSADARALLSQVHPVFMLPPVASSLFGAVLAMSIVPRLAALHATAIFLAVYTAHLKDGYVDFYGRGEDDDHPLTARGCRIALVGSSLGFFAALAVIWWTVGPVAAALTLPTWFIAYFHAPQLDTNPLTVTVGYPLGIALALVGGHYVQAGAVSPTALGLSAVFLLFLSGIKVVDDIQDYDYDRSIEKRTIAVIVGPERAYRAAYALMATGMVAVVGLAVGLEGVPPSAAAAAVAFAGVALVARRAEPELATMLLVRGSYLFLAVLVATVWFRPLR